MRTPPGHPLDVSGLRETLRDDLADLARRAALEDGADVVILGGAPLAGLAGEIAEEVPALVIDPIAAAVSQAMALARIAARRSFGARACKPVAKPSVGLGPALGRIVAQVGA